MALDSAPAGLMGWVQTYGQYILFFAQLLFWFVLCFAAVWATLLFRRLVNGRTATAGESPASTAATPAVAAPAAPSASDVSVDEFVD